MGLTVKPVDYIFSGYNPHAHHYYRFDLCWDNPAEGALGAPSTIIKSLPLLDPAEAVCINQADSVIFVTNKKRVQLALVDVVVSEKVVAVRVFS